VKTRVSIDRFEGDAKQIAVLLTGDGASFNVPRALLPRAAEAGDVLRLTIERDPDATREVAEKTRDVQASLRKTDPGGDIQL
jgi:hypothetical protein